MFLKTKAALLPLWVIAGLHLMPGSASAQTQVGGPGQPVATSTRADPADPNAPVPSAPYTSPLRAYRAFSEPQVAGWRESNELVRQRGGWRAYAREASQMDAAQPAARGASSPAPAAKPASSGHAGHEMK